MVLFINACVGSQSRTERIARAFLEQFGDVFENYLGDQYIEPLDEETLKRRNESIDAGAFSHSYFKFARQFAEADEIVIAAPYWDLSFPSKLRAYLEHVCIRGLTFRFNAQGVPEGMCKARRLTFITTAGGKFSPEYSYNYIRDLAENFFGIPETKLIAAENLDIPGSNPEAIVQQTISRYHLR